MLTYSMEQAGSESLYRYLYKCIQKDILDGNLQSGDKLPSKRSFAKNLGISTITVESAYELLMDEGYIYSLPKKGFYVSDLKLTFKKIKKDGKAKLTDQPKKEKTGIDLVANQMNPDHFPFSIWAKLIRNVISEKEKELMKNTPGSGARELREAICEHLLAYRNMAVEPSQIIIGAGSEYFYDQLIKLLKKECRYGIENPGYRKISEIIKSTGAEVCPMRMDSYGPDIYQLEKEQIDVLHVSPAHHYPTGLVMPLSRRFELLGWAARKKNRYIIEDDYDSEFRMSGKALPTLQSIDAAERVIYMNTFSKSLASTIRIGYMVLPLPLAERYHKELGFYSCTVSNFEQYTLAKFIRDGYFEKHINRMRTNYRRIRDELIKQIMESKIAGCCRISGEDAGLHFLLTVKTGMSDEQLKKKAARNGLIISCLSEYELMEPKKEDSHILIINYSGLEENKISDVVRKLEKSVLEK